MTPGVGLYLTPGTRLAGFMTMLYIKYTSFKSCCCREDFFIYFHYKSMVDNDMPGAWPVWTPGAPLAAFIKESIIHWSTQHMKARGHMVSEKKIFYVFPVTLPGRGPYGPQWHSWQDL